ncbi:hypothetical protein [Vibrio rarus]|uniref:hypothetical protein n=1 Tax=Vibrio rarus TaxID=413403 RepID=UPI0021C42881|nr:hypothetical protein [Vibrio rarus]
MSVVNSALSKLADKDKSQGQALTPADVPKIKQSKPIAWLIGGVAISMAIGSWAVSQQQPPVSNESVSDVTIAQAQQQAQVEAPAVSSTAKLESTATASSPTHSKVLEPAAIHAAPVVPAKQQPQDTPIAQDKPVTVAKAASTPVAEPSKTASPKAEHKPLHKPVKTQAVASTKKAPAVVAKVAPKPKPAPKPTAVAKKPTVAKVVASKPVPTAQHKPILLAKADTASASNMTVQQVQLTPRELANKSIVRAEKALDANDVKTAFAEYSRALRLMPSDEDVRQKLSALYYGRKDVRKAATLLQDGIRLNDKSEQLRFALAKLLIKEQQPEAALSPLLYLPDNASIDYLALRAAVAQEAKKIEMALESYKALTEQEPDNARWWLGLGIQQERQQHYEEAKASYTKALGLVGVSRNTQSFIRGRIQLLESLEGKASGN